MYRKSRLAPVCPCVTLADGARAPAAVSPSSLATSPSAPDLPGRGGTFAPAGRAKPTMPNFRVPRRHRRIISLYLSSNTLSVSSCPGVMESSTNNGSSPRISPVDLTPSEVPDAPRPNCLYVSCRASAKSCFRNRSARSTKTVFTGHWCGDSWYSGALHVGHDGPAPPARSSDPEPDDIHRAKDCRLNVCPQVVVTGSTNTNPDTGHVNASRSSCASTICPDLGPSPGFATPSCDEISGPNSSSSATVPLTERAAGRGMAVPSKLGSFFQRL